MRKNGKKKVMKKKNGNGKKLTAAQKTLPPFLQKKIKNAKGRK
jgi:hypothetical protein